MISYFWSIFQNHPFKKKLFHIFITELILTYSNCIWTDNSTFMNQLLVSNINARTIYSQNLKPFEKKESVCFTIKRRCFHSRFWIKQILYILVRKYWILFPENLIPLVHFQFIFPDWRAFAIFQYAFFFVPLHFMFCISKEDFSRRIRMSFSAL